jgi:hypothetical protein
LGTRLNEGGEMKNTGIREKIKRENKMKSMSVDARIDYGRNKN